MGTGEASIRDQSDGLRQARDELLTLAERSGDQIDALAAVAALACLEGTNPSYPAAQVLDEASFDQARQLLRDAVDDSQDLLEIGRIGDALDLLGARATPHR